MTETVVEREGWSLSIGQVIYDDFADGCKGMMFDGSCEPRVFFQKKIQQKSWNKEVRCTRKGRAGLPHRLVSQKMSGKRDPWNLEEPTSPFMGCRLFYALPSPETASAQTVKAVY